MINVIVGPPCAGKSTYVLDNAEPGDVIVDFDAIATALGSDTPHESTGDIRKIALRVRFSAIRGILDGIESDSWIIHTNPQAAIISDYVAAGASFILVDPGQDDCKQRAADRSEATVEAVEKWYENPPSVPFNRLSKLVLDLKNNLKKISG